MMCAYLSILKQVESNKLVEADNNDLRVEVSASWRSFFECISHASLPGLSTRNIYHDVICLPKQQKFRKILGIILALQASSFLFFPRIKYFFYTFFYSYIGYGQMIHPNFRIIHRRYLPLGTYHLSSQLASQHYLVSVASRRKSRAHKTQRATTLTNKKMRQFLTIPPSRYECRWNNTTRRTYQRPFKALLKMFGLDVMRVSDLRSQW